LRVALVGDSFTQGWFVDEKETIAGYLEKILGKETEVLNFGVHGYGIDQMALLTTEILPDYHPDIVVLNFIGADPERACARFLFNRRKPYYIYSKSSLALEQRELPSPKTAYENHQPLIAKSVDALKTWVGRSRLVRLFAEAILFPEAERCRGEKNVALLQDTLSKGSQLFKVYLVHLDGNLPTAFQKEAVNKKLPIYSMIEPVEKLSREISIPQKRYEDGHPKKELNFLYAKVIAKMIESRP
jgi:hypothetical protein